MSFAAYCSYQEMQSDQDSTADISAPARRESCGRTTAPRLGDLGESFARFVLPDSLSTTRAYPIVATAARGLPCTSADLRTPCEPALPSRLDSVLSPPQARCDARHGRGSNIEIQIRRRDDGGGVGTAFHNADRTARDATMVEVT